MRFYYFTHNLVPRACDPREGTRGSGIIRCRKPGILAKIELRIPFQRPIRFLPETDYPRASRSFPRIAGSGNEIVLPSDIGCQFQSFSTVFVCAAGYGLAHKSISKTQTASRGSHDREKKNWKGLWVYEAVRSVEKFRVLTSI